MIERYKDDDAGYRRWVNEHYRRGYVLHRMTRRNFSLHVAGGCGHIFADEDVTYRLTSNEKICSESETELRRFVREQGGRPPIGCESCGT